MYGQSCRHRGPLNRAILRPPQSRWEVARQSQGWQDRRSRKRGSLNGLLPPNANCSAYPANDIASASACTLNSQSSTTRILNGGSPAARLRPHIADLPANVIPWKLLHHYIESFKAFRAFPSYGPACFRTPRRQTPLHMAAFSSTSAAPPRIVRKIHLRESSSIAWNLYCRPR